MTIKNKYIYWLAVSALIFLFLKNIFGIKYTTPDDISLVIRMFDSPIEGALEISISNSRIWIFFIAFFQYWILKSQYSDLLIFTIDFFSTLSIFIAIRIGFDKTLATLWLILFSSTAVIGWWYNIFVAYPGYYFALGLIGLQVILLNKLDKERNNYYYALSLIVFTISIINYEFISLLSMSTICLFYFKNCKPLNQLNLKLFINKIYHYLAIFLIYILIYLLWQLSFPLNYEGGHFNVMEIRRSLDLFFRLLISGSSVDYLVSNFPLTYTSTIDRYTYTLSDFSFKSALSFWISNVQEVFYSLIFFSSSCFLLRAADNVEKKSFFKKNLVVLFLLFITVFLFMISVKYQNWFLMEGVKGYTVSVASLIFLTLIFALISQFIFIGLSCKSSAYIKVFFSFLATLFFIYSSNINFRNNENIILDNSRWTAVDFIFKTKIMREKLISLDYIYAPALWNHSWWMNFHEELTGFSDFKGSYWKIYTRMFFKEISFNKEKPLNSIITHNFDYWFLEKMIISFDSNSQTRLISNLTIAYPSKNEIILNDIKNNVGERIAGNMDCKEDVCEVSYGGQFSSQNLLFSSRSGNFSIRLR
jgi:hypothetical protein